MALSSFCAYVHIASFWPFFSRYQGKLYPIKLMERLWLPINVGKVNKYIAAIVTLDEAVPLLGIKPFDMAGYSGFICQLII